MKRDSMFNFVKWSKLGLISMGMAFTAHAATSTEQINEVNQTYLDSIEALGLSAGTNTAGNLYTPVGFKGNFIGRGYDAELFEAPQYTEAYKHRTQLDGELNLFMTANPNPFFTLWSTVTFGYDYSNTYFNDRATTTTMDAPNGQNVDILNNYSRVHNNRDMQREEVGMFEQMIVGADIRTTNVKMLAQAGSALWIEMSPLTIYRRETRRQYAWFYEAFEPDLTVNGYHNQKSFTRRTYGGRLTWPRKTFGGGHIDFYELPGGFNGQLLVAEPVNNFPAVKRAATLNRYGDAEGLSSFSNPGMLFAGRLARRATIGDLELGFNFLTYQVNRDILLDDGGDVNYSLNTAAWTRRFEANSIDPKISEPMAFSIDLRGKLSNEYYFMGDIAVSQTRVERWKQAQDENGYYFGNNRGTDVLDATFFGDIGQDTVQLANGETVYRAPTQEFTPSYYDDRLASATTLADSQAVTTQRFADSIVFTDNNPYYDPIYSQSEVETKDPAFAFYAKLAANTRTPYQLELMYMDRNYDSPFSISQDVVPVNTQHMKLGAGAWSYQANLTGANLTMYPSVKSGFLKLNFGVHSQVVEGPNFLRFQHKLIGRDLWKSSNSYTRTDPNAPFDGGRPYGGQAARQHVGEVGESRSRYFNEQQVGGLIGDDQALWQEFVPWKDEHLIRDSVTGVVSLSAVPRSQKFSWTAGFDWGKDFGGQLPVFWNLNGEFSIISESADPTQDLLSSALIMGEPVLGLAKNFYLIGVFGYEGWYSPYGAFNLAVNNTPETDFSYLGTNYTLDARRSYLALHQFALGLGFDWDIAARASVHVRYKWAKHVDASANEFSQRFRTEIDEIENDVQEADGAYTAAQVEELADLRSKIIDNDFTAGFLFFETKVWF